MVVNGPRVLFMLFMSLIWYCRLFTLYLSVIYRVERGNQFIRGQVHIPYTSIDAQMILRTYREDGLGSNTYIQVQ